MNAVKDSIRQAMPHLRRCELHPGDFNALEVQRHAGHAPGVFISLAGLDVDQELGNGEYGRPLQMMVYIIARDENRLTRFEAALNLVEAITEHVRDNLWDFEGAHTPKHIASKNLFTGDIDKQKVSMWAVRWTQNITLGNSLFDSEGGVLPERFYIGFDPDTGPDNIDKYVELEPRQ